MSSNFTLIYRKNQGGYSIENMFKPIEKYANNIIFLPFNDSNILFIILNIFYFLTKMDRSVKYLITGSVYYLAPFIKKGNCYSVLHDIDSLKLKAGFKGYIKYLIYIKFGISFSELVICVSDYTQKRIRLLLPNINSFIIYNYPVINSNSNNSLSYKNRKYDYLMVGTKVNKFTNESIELCLKLHKNPRIAVVGNKCSINNQYLNKIELFENINDDFLSNLYANSRYLIFLSIYEGFGLPIIESQGFGCIPIVRDKEPFKTVLGQGGFLIREKFIESDLKNIIDDFENNFNKITLRAKKNSLKYSSQKFVKSYLEVLK